ncbi:MAG TPA: hypothetical protein DEQ30_04940 [Porphyromonadaceae bacterium]|nr:hypothetical protein [Porphyromonadaceae bacterium]
MKFNLEEQYQVYLQKVKLDERKMGEVQKKETRQAFYAGISQAIMFSYALTEMVEDDAAKELDYVVKQVTDFWGLFNINEN